MAREEPARKATEVVDRDEIEMLYVQLIHLRVFRARAPPESPPDIRTFVVDLARLVGFLPSKRQPLPGIAKVWQGHKILKIATSAYRGMKELG